MKDKNQPTTGGANMTENQIQELTRMRHENMGYSHIAKALGLTKEQVSGIGVVIIHKR